MSAIRLSASIIFLALKARSHALDSGSKKYSSRHSSARCRVVAAERLFNAKFRTVDPGSKFDFIDTHSRYSILMLTLGSQRAGSTYLYSHLECCTYPFSMTDCSCQKLILIDIVLDVALTSLSNECTIYMQIHGVVIE